MPTPPDNHDDAATEPAGDFAFHTPFGTFTDADQLPPTLREALVRSLDDQSLPPEIRDQLARALRIRRHRDIQAQPHSEQPTAGGDLHGEHEAGCTCSDIHRETIWNILDQAFPTSPHLWNAMAALFAVSAVSHESVDAAAGRAHVGSATLHLQRHAELTAPAGEPESTPTEQLMARFREQLGNL